MNRSAHRWIVPGISAAVVVGLGAAAVLSRPSAMSERSSSPAPLVQAPAMDTPPAAAGRRDAAVEESIVIAADGDGARADEPIANAVTSQSCGQAAADPGMGDWRVEMRPPRWTGWPAAFRERMQRAAGGPSTQASGLPASAMRGPVRDMANRSVQAAASRPSTTASYANLWAYANRAAAQTQPAAARGPLRRPPALATQPARPHRRLGTFQWTPVQAAGSGEMDRTESPVLTGFRQGNAR